jgi:hypothetical protein
VSENAEIASSKLIRSKNNHLENWMERRLSELEFNSNSEVVFKNILHWSSISAKLMPPTSSNSEVVFKNILRTNDFVSFVSEPIKY